MVWVGPEDFTIDFYDIIGFLQYLKLRKVFFSFVAYTGLPGGVAQPPHAATKKYIEDRKRFGRAIYLGLRDLGVAVTGREIEPVSVPEEHYAALTFCLELTQP